MPPQVLYDYPCNLFVAGFIGSPQMNFLDAEIIKDGDGYAAKVCGSTIKLPARMNEPVAPYAGKTVVLGIRPEDIIAADAAAGVKGDLNVKVDIAELMGAEISLHVDCQGNRIVVRTEPTFKGREGDGAVLTLKNEKIHLFDKDTELAICH